MANPIIGKYSNFTILFLPSEVLLDGGEKLIIRLSILFRLTSFAISWFGRLKFATFNKMSIEIGTGNSIPRPIKIKNDDTQTLTVHTFDYPRADINH